VAAPVRRLLPRQPPLGRLGASCRRRTPWKNAFFLLPLIKSHQEFVFEVEGDTASFLWHIPISDEERAYKQEHGADALIERMEAVDLPWVFEENNRPSLVG
jgi:hypothetical protein